jgi:hypothetical protein
LVDDLARSLARWEGSMPMAFADRRSTRPNDLFNALVPRVLTRDADELVLAVLGFRGRTELGMRAARPSASAQGSSHDRATHLVSQAGRR